MIAWRRRAAVSCAGGRAVAGSRAGRVDRRARAAPPARSTTSSTARWSPTTPTPSPARRRRGAAGLRPRADRLRLSRSRRPGRRRPRLRHHLGGRRRAAGARLPDRRQRGLLRRQADHLRRHGAGVGGAVRSVSRLRRRQPGRATSTSPRSTARRGRRRRGCRSPRTAASSTTTSCSPRRR